jgi:protein-S-isoprenylcysteine O-methyltransferase Ste14
LALTFMQIHTVQLVRKAVLLVAILLGILVFAFTDTVAPSGELMHETVEWIGIVLIVVCILGRTWCSLYIGGRKIDELVIDGPYSVCRNPLYFFSIVGAAGMGAQTGSIVIGLICGAIAAVVFTIVVIQEEKLLLDKYGERYRDYIGRVPRLLPDPRLWHDVEILNVRPRRVVTTFMDASFFLLAVPVAELFEVLQDAGIIPVLMKLP